MPEWLNNFSGKIRKTWIFLIYLDKKYLIAGITLLCLQLFYYICRAIIGHRATCYLLKDIEVVVSIKNTRFSVYAIPTDLGYIFENFIYKSYESIPSFIPQEGDICLDIGANIGDCALSWYANNASGKIICCEPHPDTFRRLEKNIQLNGCANIKAIQAAASNRDGLLEIGTNIGAGMAVINFKRAGLKYNVEAITLDSLMEKMQIEKIDLCKIDVEGHEVEVLRGAAGALKKIKRLIVECHSESIWQEVEEMIAPYFLVIGKKEKLLFAESKL